MANVSMIPSRYVVLKRNEHRAWLCYNTSSGKIIDGHVPGLNSHDINSVISRFLAAGYKETERGECTHEINLRLRGDNDQKNK